MVDEHRPGWKVFLFTDVSGIPLQSFRDQLKERGHEIVGMLTAPPPRSRPDANDYLDVVATGAEMGIPTIVSNKRKEWPSLLRAFEPDLCICAGFIWKIPADVLEVPRLGTINIHAGKLPEYRGPDPVGWTFRNDEGALSVSAHFMTPEWDAGAVLAHNQIPYDDDSDIADLFPMVIDDVVRVLDQAVDRVENGEPGEQQDESKAGYAPFFEPEWRQIDWTMPRRFIHNQVRSWIGPRDSPRGAIGSVDGTSFIVYKTRIERDFAADGAAPGSVLSRESDSILVQCADGPLRIVEWERATDDQSE